MPDDRTMFEIYRESDYNRAFHCIFYTDLDEHVRDAEIAKAMAGATVYTGYVADDRKEDARRAIDAIVDQLNDADENDEPLTAAEIERRLAEFLVDAPA